MEITKRFSLIMIVFTICIFTNACEGNESNFSNKASNYYNMGLINIYNDTLYFVDFSSGKETLCKLDFDGKKKSIIESEVSYINIINDNIYFISNDVIYVMNIQNETIKQLSDIDVYTMVSYNSLLYACGVHDHSNEIYILDTNGKMINMIKGDGTISNLFFYKNCLYFIQSKDFELNTEIMKIDLKKGTKSLVHTDEIYKFYIYNNYIYYSTRLKLCRVQLNSSNIEVLVDRKEIHDSLFLMYDNYLYYNDSESLACWSINMDTSESKKTLKIMYSDMYIINGRFFYYKDNQLYTMDLNGNNNHILSRSTGGQVH